MSRSKYLLPYEKVQFSLDKKLDTHRYIRRFLSGKELDPIYDGHILYSTKFDIGKYWFITPCRHKQYYSLREAMVDLDKNLIKLGYVILTEEQALLI
jgi:hypothetical protein